MQQWIESRGGFTLEGVSFGQYEEGALNPAWPVIMVLIDPSCRARPDHRRDIGVLPLAPKLVGLYIASASGPSRRHAGFLWRRSGQSQHRVCSAVIAGCSLSFLTPSAISIQ